MNTLAQFSGKIYPDKTFAVGVVPPKKKRLEESVYDKRIEDTYDSYTESYSKYGRTKKREVLFVAKNVDYDRFIKGSQSSPKPKTYGSKGITRFGKKCTSCFGAILSDKYRNEHLGFGTATVPRYSDCVLRAIGQQWGEITRRFFQKLKRSCAKKGRAFIYYGVTEIQEKRYKSSGIPVPHLHWGYVCRDNRRSEFYFTANDVRRFWRESITESLSRVGVTPVGKYINYRASIDIQIVKKSIGAYMSKYLSKGVKCVQKMIDEGFESMLPKQWWFACMQMKKALKHSTVRMTQKECSSYFHGLEELLHACKVSWCNFVDVEVSPGEYRIFGVVGRLSSEWYHEYDSRINSTLVSELLSNAYNPNL